jgi:hypothetical protein
MMIALGESPPPLTNDSRTYRDALDNTILSEFCGRFPVTKEQLGLLRFLIDEGLVRDFAHANSLGNNALHNLAASTPSACAVDQLALRVELMHLLLRHGVDATKLNNDALAPFGVTPNKKLRLHLVAAEKKAVFEQVMSKRHNISVEDREGFVAAAKSLKRDYKNALALAEAPEPEVKVVSHSNMDDIDLFTVSISSTTIASESFGILLSFNDKLICETTVGAVRKSPVSSEPFVLSGSGKLTAKVVDEQKEVLGEAVLENIRERQSVEITSEVFGTNGALTMIFTATSEK